MANILLTTFAKDTSRRKKVLTIQGVLQSTGAYTTGGITIDLTTVKNPKLMSDGLPRANPSLGIVVNDPAAYTGELIPGATMKTWLLKIYTSPGLELAAAAFPAALLADSFLMEFSGSLGRF